MSPLVHNFAFLFSLLFAILFFGAIPSLCQFLGSPGGCSPIAILNPAQQPNGAGGSPQAQFQQPFGPTFGCPLNPLGAFGRQFPPPPPPPGIGGQFPPMGGQPVNVNPNFMGSAQQQQNGGGGLLAGTNFGTNSPGSSCNCGACCQQETNNGNANSNFGGMPPATNEFGPTGFITGNSNLMGGVANGAGGIEMANGGGGGNIMGMFGRRRRR